MTDTVTVAAIAAVPASLVVLKDIWIRRSTERFEIAQRREKIEAEEKEAKIAEQAKKTESLEELNKALAFASLELPEFLVDQIKRLQSDLDEERKKHGSTQQP